MAAQKNPGPIAPFGLCTWYMFQFMMDLILQCIEIVYGVKEASAH